VGDTFFRDDALRLLEKAWLPERGFCYPNKRTYPHLWMWDSCFHSIAWSAFSDPRAVVELDAVFQGQLANGFLPHMRYMRATKGRGPLAGVSSFMQPPVYVRAMSAALEAGSAVPLPLIDAARRALTALWDDRLREDLLVIVHPWESGADDSPRWDSWIGSSHWSRRRWSKFDREVLSTASYGTHGQAIGNSRFEVAPAAFNAIAADAAITFGSLAADRSWTAKGMDLAAALDARAWRDDIGLWSDVAYTGGGDSVSVPTLDGALPALCTADLAKADRAVAQMAAPSRFAAPFGLRYVARDDPAYRPAQYWRGSSWPQLNFLAVVAARRAGRLDLATQVATGSVAGCRRAGFSEYWHPETGHGLGAIPQTWAAVTVLLESPSGSVDPSPRPP
jgi:hypothetical protein